MSFTKMFGSITDSTVWGEPDPTRIVWITMLAMANRDGFVHSSVPGLAHRARVSLEACEAALETFKSPDPYSRTVDYEGRRIEAVDGGWILLNYLKYREAGNPVRASLSTEGYVYYIGLPEGSRVKIGFSKNPWARLDTLRTAEPGLEILATERGTMQLEKDRHKEFNRERLEGEWFEHSPSLRALVLDLSARDERTVRGSKAGRSTTVVEKITTVGAEAEAEAEADRSKRKKRASAPPRPEGVDAQTWDDWISLRKAKHAPVTATVVKQATAEAEKAGLTLNRFLEVWCARGSQGLQAEWLKQNERAGPAVGASKTRSAIDRLQSMKVPETPNDNADVASQRASGRLEQAAMPPSGQLPK